MNSKISLILISHKSKELVLKYINNIYNKISIIIIDNSYDLSLEKEIKKNYPNILFKFMDNNGYGAAINYGSKFVKTEYFIISNPDISGINYDNLKIFYKNAIKLKNKFSVLGPRFINADPKSIKQSDLKIEIAEMRYLSGACMFFNKSNFDLMGGFDENIFLYFDENDFCKRSIKFDKNYQLNMIRVFHDAGNSVISLTSDEKNDQDNLRNWHFIWSKFYYFRKHYGYIMALIIFFPIIIRTIFRIILYKFKNDNKNLSKYKTRWSGLINSIKNKKSFMRIQRVFKN